MSNSVWTLAAAGDVMVDREDPAGAFDHVRTILNRADITVANLEMPLTNEPVVPRGLPISGLPSVAKCLPDAGFDIMVLANNHTGNCGPKGIIDTIKSLDDAGVKSVGAGANTLEARAPTILDVNGVKVAFLAFTNLYLPGDIPDKAHPGVAVLRSHSYYYFSEVWSASGVVIPGADPKVGTVPYPEDVEMLKRCVGDAKKDADVVIVSFHSGISTKKGYLCDYERIYSKVAVDAGAEMVFAHHHHFLRGVEYYKGKPILYGLGVLVIDLPKVFANTSEADLAKLRRSDNAYAMYPRPGYPLVPPFHEDCRNTVVAILEFKGSNFHRLGLLPCYMDDSGKPVPQRLDSEHAHACRRYLNEITEIASLNGRYDENGPEIDGFQTFNVSPAATV